MRSATNDSTLISKLATGIPGFEHVSMGGLPAGRTTLVSGTSGAAKTVFAIQYLHAGIADYQQNAVFVTFEESPEDIRRNIRGFGWNIAQHERDGRWAFVDASPEPEDDPIEVGSYDLGALLARIEHAVKKVNASRVAIDSLGAVFSRFKDTHHIRRELHRLAVVLKRMGVTAILTAEREAEQGPVSRHGVEDFVADNVIILRNRLEAERRRRTLEILKFRGTDHHKGEFPFTVMPNGGLQIIPLTAIELEQKSSDVRVTSGNPELDEMCDGGIYQDSIVLLSGATGAGKTLMATEFVRGGCDAGQRCLLLAFEESRDQLTRNARGWGVDYESYQKDGLLEIVCQYPEAMGLEDHLIRAKHIIQDFGPKRVVVDSLSALERISTIRGFREFVIGLTSFVKHQEVAGFLTSTTETLMGGTSITEGHISTITDSIILLRYVEAFGVVRRGLTVLKMRGSMHDKRIREFTIDGKGMHIGAPFQNISGILTGRPQIERQPEQDRLGAMFNEGE